MSWFSVKTPPEPSWDDLGKKISRSDVTEWDDLGKKEGSSWERAALVTSQGFNQGLATALGSPVDLINFAMRKIGAPTSERPFFGSRHLNELSEALGLSGIEVRTRLERYLNRIGIEVGANAPLMIPMLRYANKLAQAERLGVPLREVGKVGKAVRDVLLPMGRSPGKAFLGETMAAASAGGGAAAGQEFEEEWTGEKPGPVGEMVGQVVGPLVSGGVSALTPGGLIKRGLRVGAQRYNPEAIKKAAQSKVGAALHKIVSENRPAFNRAQVLRKKMPGFEPSVAEATGVPSLLLTQEALEKTLTGTNLDKMVKRRSDNLSAIDAYASSSAPVGVDNPLLIVDAANGRLFRTRQKLSGRIKGLRTEQRRYGTDVSNLKIDRVSSGSDIRKALTESMRERSAQMTALAEELGVNRIDLSALKDGQLAEDTKNIANLYRKYVEDRLGAGTVDLADKLGLLDIPLVTDPAQPVTFGFLKTLRENVSRDFIAAASGANVNRAEVSLLGRMKGRIDELVAKLGDEIGEPDLAKNYNLFRKEYLKNFITVFDEGVALKARQSGDKGFYLTPDENVASLFFGRDSKKGSLSAARKWLDVFPPGSAYGSKMESVMTSVILDDLSRSVVKDGVVVPDALRRWGVAHKEVLGVLGFDPEAFTTGSSFPFLPWADEIVKRIETMQIRKRKVENSILARMLKNPSIPPDQFISDALKNPKKLQSLLRSVKGVPEARAALKRAAWAGASQIQDPGEMFRYISANEDALSRILSPEHVRNLKDIQIARAIATAVEKTGGQPLTSDPFLGFEGATGITVDSASNRLLQMHMRQIGMKYLVSNFIARYIRRYTRNHFDNSMREALYDADLAKDLALFTSPRLTLRPAWQDKGARRINSRLFNLGIQARTSVMTQESEEDQSASKTRRNSFKDSSWRGGLDEFSPKPLEATYGE